MDSKTWADAAKYAAKEAVKGDDPGHEEATSDKGTRAIDIIKELIGCMRELEKSALISAKIIAVTAKSTKEKNRGRNDFMEAYAWKLIKMAASSAGLCLLMNDLNFLEELNETLRKMSKEYIDKVEARKNMAN